jgi:hypothetical protein
MAASGAMMAAGAVANAYGSYRSSKAQQASLDYQSSVAENNAKTAQTQATFALNDGQTEAQTQDLKSAQMLGAQRAALAANNVDLGSGSANNILTTTKFMANRDHAQITDNAMRRAWGYEVQAADYSSNAKALSSMSDNISPGLAVGTSLLGSASQVSSAWNQYAAANGQPSTGTSIKNWFNS